MSDYVRMARCQLCGGPTGAILLHRQLKDIPLEQAVDSEPCPACTERLKTKVFFAGHCGHAGFIKQDYIEELVTPRELREAILERRVCEMEKCFACMFGQDIKSFETLTPGEVP